MNSEQEQQSTHDHVVEELDIYLRKETLRFLENHIQRTYKDSESLDQKARANITAASLFVSFVGSFQLIIADKPVPAGYFILLVFALILYAVMINLSLQAILPVEYFWPVAAEWDVVASYWSYATEIEYIEQIISDYLAAIDLNQKAVDKKARYFRYSGIAFGAIIIVLAAMAVLRLFG